MRMSCASTSGLGLRVRDFGLWVFEVCESEHLPVHVRNLDGLGISLIVCRYGYKR